ncbi:MAG: DUF1385 domain-containing protein [Anaerolineales bacterium]
MSNELPIYGGQAVIEGVMMRGRQTCAVAVRAPDDSIELEYFPLGGLYRSRISQLPFLRGLVVLWDALGLGMKALTFSANVQALEEEETIEGASFWLTMVLSFSLAIGLFFLLPAGMAYFFENTFGWSPWVTNLFEGLIRLALLIAYIAGIARMPDIERVYGYHGAEHKTINAFEDGAPLTVEGIRPYPREHSRCGTAFLLTVVILSILIFTLLGPMPLLPRLGSRLLLIPVLASLAYEYLRLTSRYADKPWMQPLIAPNLLIQRLTTREPEDGMIEVAIQAFNAMREREEQPEKGTKPLAA